MQKLLIVFLILIPLVLFIQSSVSGVVTPEPDFSYQTWYSNFQNGGLYPEEETYTEYDSMAYTPVYYVLWFGISGRQLVGQVISILATLAAAVLLYLLMSVLVKNTIARLLPCALFLISPAVLYWSTITRSDMLALALTLLGMYLYKRKGAVIALLILVLAFFTKQFYIVAPIVILLVELRKNYKKGLLLVCHFSFLLLLGLLIGNLVTHGQFVKSIFLFPIQSGGSSVVDTGRFISSALVTWSLNLGMPLGACILIYKGAKRQLGFWELWFFLAFVEMLICIGKPGSGTNYGLECLVVGSILTGIVAERILKGRYSEEFSKPVQSA
jgi:hypothetical protein